MKIIMLSSYIYSIYLYGNFEKALGNIWEGQNYIKYEGYYWISIKCLVLLIHPLVFLKERYAYFNESFFDGL